MKQTLVVLSILFLVIAFPALGELTAADFDKIRLIVKEEVKEEITASEKRTREYIDLKIDAVEKNLNTRIDGVEKGLNAKIGALDKRMDNMWRLMMGLFGLVAATIAIPQIIIAYRDRGRKEMQSQIDQLRAQIEAMQNTLS